MSCLLSELTGVEGEWLLNGVYALDVNFHCQR